MNLIKIYSYYVCIYGSIWSAERSENQLIWKMQIFIFPSTFEHLSDIVCLFPPPILLFSRFIFKFLLHTPNSFTMFYNSKVNLFQISVRRESVWAQSNTIYLPSPFVKLQTDAEWIKWKTETRKRWWRKLPECQEHQLSNSLCYHLKLSLLQQKTFKRDIVSLDVFPSLFYHFEVFYQPAFTPPLFPSTILPSFLPLFLPPFLHFTSVWELSTESVFPHCIGNLHEFVWNNYNLQTASYSTWYAWK